MFLSVCRFVVCRFRAREAAKKAQEAEKDALQNVVCAYTIEVPHLLHFAYQTLMPEACPTNRSSFIVSLFGRSLATPWHRL